MKTLDDDVQFCYHNDNQCYKCYTRKESLEKIIQEKEKDAACSLTIDESSQKVLLSSTTPRSRARSELDSDELPCNVTVCGSDRVQVSQQRIRTKYRISEVDGARNFSEAAKFLNDSVSVKVAYIDTVAEVFAADIFYHSQCMRKYLHAYDRAKIQDEQDYISPGAPATN